MTKVLIVEDEKSLSEAYQLILERHGYAVRVAGNGEEALAALDDAAPDVILLDMKMPKLDGLGFLRQLAKRDARPAVVVFSNQDNQSEIDEAYSLGAEHYILKAWASPKELIHVVESAVKK